MNQTTPQERLLRIDDIIGNRRKGVIGLLPMSRSKFYELVKNRTIPPPAHLGCNSFWPLSSIQAVIDSITGKGVEHG